VLLGTPFNVGVHQAGGRAGAAGGPAALRRALEHCGSTFDVESGIDFHELLVADAQDLEVLEALRHEIERLAEKTTDQLVSPSLDVFAVAYPPGVSDPGTEGLTPEEGRGMAFEAGRAPGVGLLELTKLNPRFDSDGRTVRLAQMLLCAFLAGLTERNTT